MGKGKDGEQLLACCAMCGAVAFLFLAVILVLLLIGLGIAKIVIDKINCLRVGAMYLHDCDIEKMVPIFLIVNACAPILFGGLGKGNDDEGFGAGTICGVIGFLFNIAWLVCGSVWVYGTWGKLKSDSYIPCNGTHVTEGCTPGTCNDTLLTFSFAMLTIDWIFTGLWIFIIACKIIRVCSK